LADWLSKAYLLVILRYSIDGAIFSKPNPKPNLNPKPNPNPNGMFEI
jgi:hypothetical protein